MSKTTMLKIHIKDDPRFKSPGKYMMSAPSNCDRFAESIRKLGGISSDCPIYCKCDGYELDMAADYTSIIKLDKPLVVEFLGDKKEDPSCTLV